MQPGRRLAHPFPFAGDEEVRAVAAYRPAGGEPGTQRRQFGDGRYIVDHQFTGQSAAAVEAEGRGLEVVGARPGDRVQGPAGEPRLADVEGCDLHLELLHGLDGNDPGPGAPPRDVVGRKSEDILVERAVDVQGVEAVARTGHRHPLPGSADQGGERGEIEEVARQGGEFAEDLGGHKRGDADPSRVEDRIRLDLDDQPFDLDGRRYDRDVQVDEPAQQQFDALTGEFAEPDARHGDRVGAAGTLAAQCVPAVGDAEGGAGGAGTGVDQGDQRGLDGRAVLVDDSAAESPGGGALCGDREGGREQCKGREARNDRRWYSEAGNACHHVSWSYWRREGGGRELPPPP